MLKEVGAEMRISELFESVANSISLRDLYNGDFPDRDELFWDYVRQNEIDVPLAIHQLPAYKLKIMLLSQYRAEHIEEILDMIDDDRSDLIAKYENDPSLSNKMIVLCDGKIIDGNHRALAAALGNKPINYVDLADLEE
jgi:hypothetical protein